MRLCSLTTIGPIDSLNYTIELTLYTLEIEPHLVILYFVSLNDNYTEWVFCKV